VPTEAGAGFLAADGAYPVALDEAEHSVSRGGELRGLLRMSMPTSFGIRTVIPRLSAFVARHRTSISDFSGGQAAQDLVRDGCRRAIRLGRLSGFDRDNQASSRQSLELSLPSDYLQRHGVPRRQPSSFNIGSSAARRRGSDGLDVRARREKRSDIVEPPFLDQRERGPSPRLWPASGSPRQAAGHAPRVGGRLARPVIP